jgi:hypothetical protein
MSATEGGGLIAPYSITQEGFAVPDRILCFCRAMKEATLDEFDWLYFLEKPWKWESEYGTWQIAGQPQDPEDAGWAQFEASV